MNDVAPLKFGMGAPVRRKEDKALITGAGRFTDDYTPAGTLRAYVFRSSVAHARFKIDVAAARDVPGVHLVLTAEDIPELKGLPCKAKTKFLDGRTAAHPPHPILAIGTVRHVGDPIAFIVADDLDTAKLGAEAIEIDYEPLDVVVDAKAA